MTDQKPAPAGEQLRIIRAGMSRATSKYMPGGRENPKVKTLPLRLPPEKR